MADKKDSLALREAYMAACANAKAYISDGVDSDDNMHVKVVMGVLGAYTRMRAVENNEAAITFGVAKEMAEDRDELESMVRKSLPEYAGE